MRSEFEKNRYWIGLYRSDVDFDETLGEFGRYVANGSRKFDVANLESFNEKWEAYANAYQHQQSKIDELQKRVDAVKGLAQTLWEKSEEKHQQGKVWESKTLGECADEILDVLEQALKGGEA